MDRRGDEFIVEASMVSFVVFVVCCVVRVVGFGRAGRTKKILDQKCDDAHASMERTKKQLLTSEASSCF